MLAELESADIRLSAAGERLRVNAPKGKLNTSLREAIAEHKEDLLLLVREREASLPIRRSPLGHDGPSPLSFAQERLWFLEQLEPGRSVYNLCRAVRIAGALDLHGLEQSLKAITERHQALRTKFFALDGRPVQAMVDAQPMVLRPVDLRRLSPAERERVTTRRLLEAANRPFDLTEGRLLRVLLLRLGDAEHVLAVSTHHMVADAWSMGILFRELWTFYEAFIHNRAPALPALAIQYRDYAARQRELFRRDALKSELGFWKAQLAHLPVLDLPTDRPRPSRQSYRGARQKIELPPSLSAALNDLSRREGVTLFMTLLAGFQLLLHRYSGQEDIAVGSPVANRDSTEIEGLIGFFVNTLVLRASLAGEASFTEILRRVREVCLDAYAHQTLPFEKLVEALNPARDLDRNPLFQAMFVLQNTPGAEASAAGLALTTVEIESASSQFDLSLYLRERSGRIVGFFEYAADLFEGATIARMAGHFQALLESAVANPARSIGTLPMVAGAERRRVIYQWNDTAADYPREACVHELFEAQVQYSPDAPALEFEGECATYRELNRRANGLARSLRKLGVGVESLVGVLLDRGFDMVASLLAVLKAGGAYVPLDPAYPRERLAFMLGDARVGVVLTQAKYTSLVADEPETVVCVEDLLPGSGGGDVNLSRETSADNAAHVIYTSGSTGHPKGVVGLHRGAVNRFCWMWKTYPFMPDEVACQKTSLSFVDSVWEIFGALLQGIPTAIVPDPIAKDPQLLVRHLAERKVTRLVAVPSLLQAILDQCPDVAGQLRHLKFCISSGEALSAELAERFRRTLPECRLINIYGSSEVSADVACFEIGGGPGAAIPIGRPIHNTQIYLLDHHRQPVPIGVPGEIYVGGDNLARGYLYRPELTAEKFIANPFKEPAGACLYRTGDLARYRVDGNIEFLGRADHQVKIRGCRIELSEIEAVLKGHPGVKECVVIAIESMRSEAPPSFPSPIEGEGVSDSDRSLIAYIVCDRENTSAAELRGFLKEELPEFMIPAHFVSLDRMPLLPNGKVDRGALPDMRSQRLKSQSTSEQARTETEKLVAQVWQQILKIERVGVEDNFFELGGHSLLAAAVVAKLRDALGTEVSIRELFEAPTVAGLAEIVDKRLRAGAAPELPPISISRRTRLSPVSLGQEPLFLFSQLFGGGDFLNMPYAYRLSGPLDLSALRRAVQEIVRRHASLRAGFVEASDGPKAFARARIEVKMPLIDLSRLTSERRGERVERLSRDDAAMCFDAETPPLWRVKLLRLSEEHHILLVTMHHLITDQGSMGLFRKELALLYEAFSQGMPSPLPDLSFQYADFAAWQRRMISDGRLSKPILYWRKQLGEPARLLDFHGTARPRRRARFHSTRRAFELDDGLFSGIKRFAGEKNCTPFMFFLTALFLLLHRLTGEEDLRIATLVANRAQPGTEGLIGYFVNALVLRARVSPKRSVKELLAVVRQVCLSAYAHADLPFEHLEGLLEKKDPRRSTPLYQVMLNYRSLSTPPQNANGLTIASWDGKNRASDPGIAISRLDVNVHLREVSTKLTGVVNFRTDLFDNSAMAGFLSGYAEVLDQMIRFPERNVSKLSIGWPRTVRR